MLIKLKSAECMYQQLIQPGTYEDKKKTEIMKTRAFNGIKSFKISLNPKSVKNEKHLMLNRMTRGNGNLVFFIFY